MGTLFVFLHCSLPSLTIPHLSLSSSLLVGVKRVISGDLCVSSFIAPLLPLGGICASLTSESLPQRCSDVLRCFLKNLCGDCHHCRRCHITPCVPLPVVMDHSQDAGLQNVVLRAGRESENMVAEVGCRGGRDDCKVFE